MAPIRSKRKKSLNGSLLYSSKRQRDKDTDNGGLQGMQQGMTATEISTDLLQRCFGLLQEGIWWRILPIDHSYDDISVGIGIDWEYLLPLLINSKLLFAKAVDTGRRVLASRDLWANLATVVEGIQMGSYNYNYTEDGKNKLSRQYFICRGVPIYNSPHRQLQDVHTGRFVYHQLTHRPGGAIRRGVTAHASTII